MKRALKIILFLTVAITVIAGVLLFRQNGKLKPTNQETGISLEKTAVQNVQPDILVTAKTSGTKIVIYITPSEGSDNLLAFSLRLNLKTGYNLLTTDQVEPDQQMIRNGWHFLIKKITKNSQGIITIDLSAVFISSDIYKLEGAQQIASIDFPKLLTEKELDLSIDEEVTKFISSDGVTKINYLNGNKLK
jgi:hypothetical protein